MPTLPTPYRDPAEHRRSSSAGAVSGLFIKWLYLAAAAVVVALAFWGTDLAIPPLTLVPVAQTPSLLGLAWLHLVWSSVPELDRRFTRLGESDAAGAVLRLFIPFYGLYWAYSVHVRLCEAINHSLTMRLMPTRTYAIPAVLATLASHASLVVLRFDRGHVDRFVMLQFGTYVLWFVYMAYTDAARRIMVLAYLAAQEKDLQALDAPSPPT